MLYSAYLKKTKGQYLPMFTKQQKQLVQGSLDYIAANCFSAKWVSAKPGSTIGWQESKTDRAGKLIGAATGVSWINVVPWSQRKMLEYLTRRYTVPSAVQTHGSSTGNAAGDRPAILVSSSGVQVPGEDTLGMPTVLQDTFRINYYRSYLDSVCDAVASGGVRLIGWFAWSLLDGFEWTDGHKRKFGLVHVQYTLSKGTSADIAKAGGELQRTPKQSALWLSEHFFKPGA
eukprot:GHRR01022467.1.p1 GENE.GHRR01022467.1~~GHRR01022467.1.p1  ORF type:complete len:230 (+),score=49.32 GHRR01022467.1:545-1234(+)